MNTFIRTKPNLLRSLSLAAAFLGLAQLAGSAADNRRDEGVGPAMKDLQMIQKVIL